MENIIEVKQLPIIVERLKEMSEEIDKKVDLAKSLICTEDTVKEVKKTRAEFNAQFTELEEQRKTVKKAVLEPYNQFESVYKECVSDKFKSADSALKSKIIEVEDELKGQKEQEVREYFIEYLQSVNIDWLTWDMANIKITMSVSVKKLKEQAAAFVDGVVSDLTIISTQGDSAEILVEYKKTRNLQMAITTVKEHKEQLEHMKQAEERRRAAEDEKAKHAEQVQRQVELSAPKIQERPKIQIYVATFKVKGTLEQLKELKGFLRERGIEYEC